MLQNPEERLDPRAITLWRLEGALAAVLFLGVLVSGSLALLAVVFHWVLLLGALGLFLGYVLWRVLFIPNLRYRQFRYSVTEHDLYIQRGVFVVKRTLIPLVRVQHVDTVQGPLAKQLGLSALTVSTAAGAQVIPALSEAAADELRQRIAALARVAREAL